MATSLKNFGLHQMLTCSNGVRTVMRDARTMESAARRATKFFYDELGDEDQRACALVRIYRTLAYSALQPDLKTFAGKLMPAGKDPAPALRCLTLLATRGDSADWNDRRKSKGHQAIPLPTAAVVERAPMVAGLIRAFGIDIAAAVAPTSELMHDLSGKTYGVFHVRDARNSTVIPAQDFVERYGIRSVIGFGGSLPDGDLFATLLFTRVDVDASAADRFRTVALDLKSRFFSFQPHEVFDPDR